MRKPKTPLVLGHYNFIAEKPIVVIWSNMEGTEFSTRESAEVEIREQSMLGNVNAIGARIFTLREDQWEQAETPT